MKKKIKKILSYFFPKGYVKEKIKLFYYNLNKNKDVNFDVVKNENSELVFKTCYKDMTFNTVDALYSIVDDFDYYQHFYKIKENDIVIDAGSNVGNISLLFSKLVGKNGIVYCFEPDKFNEEILKKNFSLNSDFFYNWIVCDFLLWKENTELNFQESGTVSSSAVWFTDKENSTLKKAVSLDNWYKTQNLKTINYIKMDIEGAEIEALEGCIEIIQKFKPDFAIASYHIVNNEPTYIKLESFFKKINYPFKTITFRRNEIITFAGPNVRL